MLGVIVSSSILIIHAQKARAHTAQLLTTEAQARSTPQITVPVWPIPQQISSSCGQAVQLSPNFKIIPSSGSASPRLARAINRLRIPLPGTTVKPLGRLQLQTLTITVAEVDSGDVPRRNTNESYTLGLQQGAATVRAKTVFGAMHALETFTQIVNKTGWLVCTGVDIIDFPQFQHRGVMLDTGRRHFPVPLVKTILDGMSAGKLNVLHLHLSDFGGYRVHSDAFPSLTSGLVDDEGRVLYWNMSDIREMVAYAADRGIRVIPEVDLPGHAAAFNPLSGEHGIQFCTTNNSVPGLLPSQIYDDPEGRSWSVLKTLLEELFPLFPDDIFHLGADETGRDVKGGPCAAIGAQNNSNAAQLERKLLQLVLSAGKQPCAWEEMLIATQAAVNTSTIISAWHSMSAAEVTAAGHEAIECAGDMFYLDHPKGSPKSWGNLSTYWVDIAPVCSDSKRCFSSRDTPQYHRMLGGEVSLWSDHYCFWNECHATRGGADFPRGCAWYLSGRYANLSKVFAQSVVAMVFPRASIAGGSFWNFVPALPLDSDGEVWTRLSHHAEYLQELGVSPCPSFSETHACPNGCSEAAQCGVKYPGWLSSKFPLESNCPYHA